MKSRFFISTVTLFAAATFFMAHESSWSKSENKITGTITAPYADAVIMLVDADGDMVDTDITNSKGEYFFSEVEKGQYTIVLIDPVSTEEAATFSASIDEGGNTVINGVVTRN